MASYDYSARWTKHRGSRPVKIANCSGYKCDPGYHMRYQAELGDVDFITGDYLAEVNIAENAQAHAAGQHPGWEETAWDGIKQTIHLLAQKRIKVIVNGGAHNPKGLAEKVHQLVTELQYPLKVAYVLGDNLFNDFKDLRTKGLPPHLDSDNADVQLAEHTLDLLEKGDKPVVSANAYLGAREIVRGLQEGADIIIAGRVADASPVVGAAWYWWSWAETAFDELAGALIAGHLIECSGYVTGTNFAGFYEYDLDDLYEVTFGIAEVEKDGTCVITKHDAKKGFVTEDTVKCQFLYELQGNVYLNSDVKAVLDGVQCKQVGKNRVRIWGIKGRPPPPTTKLAIFYKSGYQSEFVINATGYATAQKYDLWERIIRHSLQEKGLLSSFDVLEFQRIGTPSPNPRSQLSSTTSLRFFATSSTPSPLLSLASQLSRYSMHHFSGFHCTSDARSLLPRPTLSFYPSLIPQSSLQTSISLLSGPAAPYTTTTIRTSPPSHTEPLSPRSTYETQHPVNPNTFGATAPARLGDILLARSGDKGGNANIGFFVPTSLPSSYHPRSSALYAQTWDWARGFLTVARLKEMMCESWPAKEEEGWHVERVEFEGIMAVHFVVYGVLGRGVSGSARLDAFGKGIGDWLRDVVVQVPVRFLEGRGLMRGEGGGSSKL